MGLVFAGGAEQRSMMTFGEAVWLVLNVAAMLVVPVHVVCATMRHERAVRDWSARGSWRHEPMPGTFTGSDPD